MGHHLVGISVTHDGNPYNPVGRMREQTYRALLY